MYNNCYSLARVWAACGAHIVSCIVNCLLQNPQQTEAVMRLRIKLNIVGGLAALNRFMS